MTPDFRNLRLEARDESAHERNWNQSRGCSCYEGERENCPVHGECRCADCGIDHLPEDYHDGDGR
jgi:hypothetical protein